VYNGTTAATVTLTDNRVAADSLALTTGYAAASFASKNAGYQAVSVSGITLTGTSATNYALGNTTASTNATITALSLTATPIIASKTYDGTTAATISGYTLPGVLAGDTVTATGGTAIFASKNAANGVAVAVTGITLTGAQVANYSVNSTAATTANIASRTLTITATGIDRVQNGTTTATVLLGDNRVGSDVFTNSYTAATFPSSSPGTYTVNVSGISISGADAANYTYNTTATTTATITSSVTAPTMVSQPVSKIVTPGTSVSFSASATGSPTVQWQSSTNGGTTWTNIANANSTTYTVTSTLAANGTLYRAVFTNSAGSVTSATASLNVALAQISSVTVLWGSQSASLSDAAPTAGSTVTRLLPAGRKNSIPWLNINTIKITLDRAVSTLTVANLTLTSAVVGTAYTVTSVSGSGTNWTISFKNNSTVAATAANGIITADRVSVSLSNNLSTVANYTRQLNVLPGDVLDTGTVSAACLSAIRNYYTLGIVPSVSLIFLDLNGDGKVDASDYNAAAPFLGKKLV